MKLPNGVEVKVLETREVLQRVTFNAASRIGRVHVIGIFKCGQCLRREEHSYWYRNCGKFDRLTTRILD